MSEKFLPSLKGTDFSVEVKFEDNMNVVYLFRESNDPLWPHPELVTSSVLVINTLEALDEKVAIMIAAVPDKLTGNYTGNEELEAAE